jgi:ABC-type multidrug transport system fused ATPase/permease subunit
MEKQENRMSSISSRNSSASNLTNLESDYLQEREVLSLSMGETPHFEFRDAVFAYPSRPKKRVFNGFNLKIKEGETVALVGPR